MVKTIFRTKLSKNFTILPNELLRNRQLSFKARGILAMILTNNDEWEVNKGWIESQGTEGRESITSAIVELKALGYVTHIQEKGGDGKFRSIWTFRDAPAESEALPPTGSRLRETVDGKPSPSEESSRSNRKEKKETAPLSFSIPLNLNTKSFTAIWEQWVADRKERRKPLTAKAAELQLRDLAAWGEPEAIQALENAIQGGWLKPYRPKAEKESQQRNNYQHASVNF